VSVKCRLLNLGLVWVLLSVSPLGIDTATAQAEVGGSLVVLDFELKDDMKYGGHAPGHEDVLRRTRALADGIRRAVAAGLRYKLVDAEPFAEKFAELADGQAHLHTCQSCIVEFGSVAGADYVLTGWVQRVSNLIINFNVKIYDVRSGQLVDGGSIDIRGNTDKTWQDGLGYIVKHLPLGF